MQLLKDHWRVALIEERAEDIMRRGAVSDASVHWLPRPAEGYYADPFGAWKDDHLHVFVEEFDYRVRRGRITRLTLDASYKLVEVCPALQLPWHLSYPSVFTFDDDFWMVPESHEAGALHLYRAASFPTGWERVATLLSDQIVLDATLFRHMDRWWMLANSGPTLDIAQHRLTLHSAQDLTGPWREHPASPLLVSPRGGRPGGTPLLIGGQVVIPVQDSMKTYGGALLPLFLEGLEDDHIVVRVGSTIGTSNAFAPYLDGMHTLSAAGNVTLLDVKQRTMSPKSVLDDIVWKTSQLTKRAATLLMRDRLATERLTLDGHTSKP